MKKLLLLLPLAFLLGGCAGLKVLPLTDNKTQEGLRFYEPIPYLLVSSSKDEKGNETLKMEVVYLPNYERGYVVQRKSGLGKVNVTAKLANGWQLTELGGETDSQVGTSIEALSKLLPALPFTGAGKGEATKLTPGLYKIDLKTNTLTKIGS